jgi:hypothetical protein
MHTLKTRNDLMEYLGLDEECKIPKGFNLDHIKERSTCVTDEDFETINYFTNLRLYPAADNLARNWLKYRSSFWRGRYYILGIILEPSS